ncbi:hypothetical protein BYT27DRAFT_7253253 [Phlegmacium glaucopus]|nr:hypothetical protein BYT27DRAFT_7253253 [Phlegmacium glaucopus]
MNMIAEIKDHDHGLDEWLSNAIVRYAQFMRLPEAGCVPPVDVDIIWHTHQLAGPKYWGETLFFFGVHIDHNDDITPQAAHQAF